MYERIRAILAGHAGMSANIADIGDNDDLYRAGMKSMATVQLMLALEEAFDLEFPEELLTRTTFRSVSTIAQALRSVDPNAATA